ncbi:MAG: C39 family peptidase [Patescibacteria group bacterium]
MYEIEPDNTEISLEMSNKSFALLSKSNKKHIIAVGAAVLGFGTIIGISETPQREVHPVIPYSQVKKNEPIPIKSLVTEKRINVLFHPQSPQIENLQVRDVHYYSQNLLQDCEITALQMALSHEGIYVSQNTLLSLENVDPRPPVMDGSKIVKWGNPYTSFVGNPNAQETIPPTGYGTYYPNIVRVAESVGGKVLWGGTGLTIPEMLAYLKENHPVIAWVDSNYKTLEYSPLSHWTAFDGKSIEYPTSGYEHTVLIAGFNTTTNLVSVYNPLPFVGIEEVPLKVFESSFGTFNNMAVVMG